MVAIRRGLQILVTVSADRHDHIGHMPTSFHEEGIFARFDGLDGFFLAEFPARATGVNPADCLNPLMRIGTVGFIDAFHFMTR